MARWTQYRSGMAAGRTKEETIQLSIAPTSNTTFLELVMNWGSCAGLDRGLRELNKEVVPKEVVPEERRRVVLVC